MDFKELLSLKYKNVDYNMYIDNRNKHYFLKKDVVGNLYYPEMDELIGLAIHFVTIPNVMNIKTGKFKKAKLIPKVILGGASLTLTASLIIGFLSSSDFKNKIKSNVYGETSNVYEITTTVEKYLADNSYEFENAEDVKLDTYVDQPYLRIKYVNDMAYLDYVVEEKEVSKEQMLDVINSNPNITDNFKKILYSYIDALYAKYPDVDKRVLYENLKTIKIYEVNEYDLLNKTLSADSSGCYIRNDNEIYVKEGCKFEPGTWDNQVIWHELTHPLRLGNWVREDETIKVDVEGQTFKSTILSEALNSLFAVSLFDYEEKDIAYQLQSNYLKIMINSMDNYTLSDYVNHSLSYFVEKLNEQNNNKDAVDMLNLLEVQYDDYHSDELEISQDQYYRLYDYIANMYYSKYITADMTYDDALEVKNEMMDTIMYDVPEEYNIDTAHFDEFFENYCNELGITSFTR